jgi:hypothetical protein
LEIYLSFYFFFDKQENVKLKEELSFWKKKIYEMRILIENSIQEDIIQDREIDVYISKLSKENFFLRKILGLAISEDCSKLIDEKLCDNENVIYNSSVKQDNIIFIKNDPTLGNFDQESIHTEGFNFL